ncbi:MAG: sulfurase, partial [Bacilli bacterium]|nr:sulfurase [Bacilli bacterium]
KQGWAKYITARQVPQMLQYKAEIVHDSSENEFTVKVTSPNELSLNWDENLHQQIQSYVTNNISMICFRPDGSDQMAFDTDSILIITDSSLRMLETIYAKKLDQRRFRPNIIITLTEDNAFIESDWVGKRIFVGDVELSVNVLCERCTIITFDPDTLEQDLSLLKKLAEVQNCCFGVYASVAKTGEIKVGDSVYLVQ